MKQFILKTYSEQYDVHGTLYLLNDGYYYIEAYMNDKTYGRKLPYKEPNIDDSIKNDVINDVAWMTLEDLIEDILLGVFEE